MPGEAGGRPTELERILEGVRVEGLEPEALCGAVYDILASAEESEALQGPLLDLLPLEALGAVESLLAGRRRIADEYAARLFGLEGEEVGLGAGAGGARAGLPGEGGGPAGPPGPPWALNPRAPGRDLDGEPAGPVVVPSPSRVPAPPGEPSGPANGLPDEPPGDPYAEAVGFLAAALCLERHSALDLLNKTGWDLGAAIDLHRWRERERRRRLREAGGGPGGGGSDTDSESDSEGGAWGPRGRGGRGRGVPWEQLDRPSGPQGDPAGVPPPPYHVRGASASASHLLGSLEVDLHGYRMAEAEQRVRELVNGAVRDIEAQRRPERCAVQITLITGRGVHSAGQPTIRRLVGDLLRQNRIRHWPVEGTRGGAVRLVVTADTPML